MFRSIFSGLVFVLAANATAQSIADEKARVNEAINLAHSILNRASQRSGQLVFFGVEQALTSSHVRWQPYGRDWNLCIQNKLNAYHLSDQTIYLCRRVIDLSASYHASQIAEILIHESRHIEGYTSECDATRVEVSAMRWAGQPIAIRNDYLSRCGIR